MSPEAQNSPHHQTEGFPRHVSFSLLLWISQAKNLGSVFVEGRSPDSGSPAHPVSELLSSAALISRGSTSDSVGGRIVVQAEGDHKPTPRSGFGASGSL